MGVEAAAAVRRTVRKAQKTQAYVPPEASGKALPHGRLVPTKPWSNHEESNLIQLVEQEGFGGWKSKAQLLGTGRSPDEVRAKAISIRAGKEKERPQGLLPVGTLVEALYHHVEPREFSAWYRAEIKRVDERRETYVIDWEDGDKSLRTQPAKNVRPLPWGVLSNTHKAAARQTAAKLLQHQSMETSDDDSDDMSNMDMKKANIVGMQDEKCRKVTGWAETANGGKCEAHYEETEGDTIDEDVYVGDKADRRNEEEGSEEQPLSWSQSEQNQLRKMLLAGRNDWETMGASIGLGRTARATMQHAAQLQKQNDLQIDKRPEKFTEWGVMSQPTGQKGKPIWKKHYCIDAAILENWAYATPFRSCPGQIQLRADPSLCVNKKRANILKCCLNGTHHFLHQ